MLAEFTAAIGPQNASSITAAHLITLLFPVSDYLSVLPGLKQLKVVAPSFGCDYLNEFWLPQMSEYAQYHPSDVIEIYGLPEGVCCADAQMVWLVDAEKGVTIVSFKR